MAVMRSPGIMWTSGVVVVAMAPVAMPESALSESLLILVATLVEMLSLLVSLWLAAEVVTAVAVWSVSVIAVAVWSVSVIAVAVWSVSLVSLLLVKDAAT